MIAFLQAANVFCVDYECMSFAQNGGGGGGCSYTPDLFVTMRQGLDYHVEIKSDYDRTNTEVLENYRRKAVRLRQQGARFLLAFVGQPEQFFAQALPMARELDEKQRKPESNTPSVSRETTTIEWQTKAKLSAQAVQEVGQLLESAMMLVVFDEQQSGQQLCTWVWQDGCLQYRAVEQCTVEQLCQPRLVSCYQQCRRWCSELRCTVGGTSNRPSPERCSQKHTKFFALQTNSSESIQQLSPSYWLDLNRLRRNLWRWAGMGHPMWLVLREETGSGTRLLLALLEDLEELDETSFFMPSFEGSERPQSVQQWLQKSLSGSWLEEGRLNSWATLLWRMVDKACRFERVEAQTMFLLFQQQQQQENGAVERATKRFSEKAAIQLLQEALASSFGEAGQSPAVFLWQSCAMALFAGSIELVSCKNSSNLLEKSGLSEVWFTRYVQQKRARAILLHAFVYSVHFRHWKNASGHRRLVAYNQLLNSLSLLVQSLDILGRTMPVHGVFFQHMARQLAVPLMGRLGSDGTQPKMLDTSSGSNSSQYATTKELPMPLLASKCPDHQWQRQQQKLASDHENLAKYEQQQRKQDEKQSAQQNQTMLDYINSKFGGSAMSISSGTAEQKS